MKIFTPLFLFILFAAGCKKAEQPEPVISQPISVNPKEIIFTNYHYNNNGPVENNVKLVLTRAEDKVVKVDWYRKDKNTDYSLWFTEDKTVAVSSGYQYQFKSEYENGKLSKTTRTDTDWDEIEEVTYTNYLDDIPQQIHAVSKSSVNGNTVYSEFNYSLSVQNGDIQINLNNVHSGYVQYLYGNSFNPLKGLLGQLPVFSDWYSNMEGFNPIWFYSKKNPISLVVNGNTYYQFEYTYDQNNRPVNIKTYNTNNTGSFKKLYRDVQIKY